MVLVNIYYLKIYLICTVPITDLGEKHHSPSESIIRQKESSFVTFQANIIFCQEVSSSVKKLRLSPGSIIFCQKVSLFSKNIILCEEASSFPFVAPSPVRSPAVGKYRFKMTTSQPRLKLYSLFLLDAFLSEKEQKIVLGLPLINIVYITRQGLVLL